MPPSVKYKKKREGEQFDPNPKSHISLLEVGDYDGANLNAAYRYRSTSEEHIHNAGGFIDLDDEWQFKHNMTMLETVSTYCSGWMRKTVSGTIKLISRATFILLFSLE